ncbi:MAG: hypothetical protein ACI89J_001376 [Hyphomicrobiaceae bacterium]
MAGIKDVLGCNSAPDALSLSLGVQLDKRHSAGVLNVQARGIMMVIEEQRTNWIAVSPLAAR